MKVKVITTFRDKDNFSVIYLENTVVDFEEERAKKLIARKLVEEVKPKKK